MRDEEEENPQVEEPGEALELAELLGMDGEEAEEFEHAIEAEDLARQAAQPVGRAAGAAAQDVEGHARRSGRGRRSFSGNASGS